MLLSVPFSPHSKQNHSLGFSPFPVNSCKPPHEKPSSATVRNSRRSSTSVSHRISRRPSDSTVDELSLTPPEKLLAPPCPAATTPSLRRCVPPGRRRAPLPSGGRHTSYSRVSQE